MKEERRKKKEERRKKDLSLKDKFVAEKEGWFVQEPFGFARIHSDNAGKSEILVS